MHRAKAFFYVCAGLLCLALACHLGARSVQAQAPPVTVSSAFGGRFAAVVGRTVYSLYRTVGTSQSPPVPGSDPIIAASGGAGTDYAQALLSNGDCYSVAPGGSWEYDGNLFGGPTPAKSSTLGQVKVRYRGERGAAQPVPQDR